MIEIIASVVGIILLGIGFKMACKCPYTDAQIKSFEKDAYLRGKK